VTSLPALQALVPSELASLCEIDLVDARRIVSLIHKRGSLPERSPATVRRVALDRAKAAGALPELEVREKRASTVDPFVKYAFGLHDGRVIETVRIPLEKPGRFSVCVSSQAGCALACAFCATGKLGLARNLEVWEIVEQVRRVRAELPEGTRVHGVVFQGMGEPLSNAERVIRAIRVLSEPSGQAIDRRNITVCTAGLPAGIRALIRAVPDVRLGLSLGDVRPDRRRRLMPIDDKNPLEEVLVAVGEHAKTSGHAPMWAYTLLAGDNDTADAAEALAALVLSFTERYGVRPRLSLIPFNPSSGLPFRTPTPESVWEFRTILRERGVGSILRYSGGGDVGAACGQLAPVAGFKAEQKLA
jgi:23S rRNA (adenine2503-C2)-methyltransferase